MTDDKLKRAKQCLAIIGFVFMIPFVLLGVVARFVQDGFMFGWEFWDR